MPTNGTTATDREASVIADPAAFAHTLFAVFLQRSPSGDELRIWTDRVARSGPQSALEAFAALPEIAHRRGVWSFWPPGHYHSPVVDPQTVHAYLEREHTAIPGDLAAIPLDLPAMLEFWNRHQGLIASAPFPEHKTPGHRFSFEGPFPYGDALTLLAMMAEFRPRQIVEIGSGFSTACMLDAADLLALHDLEIRCIEPYPARLRSLLRSEDWQRVSLTEAPVQDVPALEIVRSLRAGDILFIDSTHVLKTGSDVHYEMFHILPTLPAGVVIHVHDCPFPFEYPDLWVFERNFSWNEAYALRAFLMFNDAFRVLFWPSLFRRWAPDLVRRDGGRFAGNPGSSIWLQKMR